MAKAGPIERYRDRPWFAASEAGIIVLVTLLAYIPSLRNGFIWDDYAWIVRSPIINTPDALYRYWLTFQSPDYFPFVHTLFWVQWKLWGANSTAWHLASVLLHAGTAVAAWWTLRRLRIPGAWLAALVFAVHPVNVESVGWIYQQRTILPMLLSLLSLLAYLRAGTAARPLHLDPRATPSPDPVAGTEARPLPNLDPLATPSPGPVAGTAARPLQGWWYAVSLLAFVLAMLSKVSVALLPVILLGTAWWERGRIEKKDLIRSIPFFVAAVGLGLLTAYVQAHRNIGSDIVRTDAFPARLAGAGWAVWFYLFKDLLSTKLLFVYPRWEINPASIASYLPLGALIACFALVWRFRETWGRPVLAGLGWFVLMLFPVLGFVNIYFMRYSLVTDHWQYSAILGVIALVVGIGARVVQRNRWQGVGIALAVIPVLVLGAITWRQQGIYKNEETLWRDTIARNPTAWMAHNNLGLVLAERGKTEEAMAEYEAALRIKPDCPEAHVSLAASLIERKRLDKALGHLSEALRLKPDSVFGHYNMGRLLAEQGKLDKAADEYGEVLRLNPYFAKGYTNLGVILFHQGKTRDAIAHHRKALGLDAGLPEAHNNLGVALAAQGKMREAAREFREAVRLKPDYVAAQRNLERALGTSMPPQEHFEAAGRLAEQGKLQEAAAEYREALHLRPDDAEALNNLGAVLVRLGMVNEAVDSFRRSLSIKRENAGAHSNLAAGLFLKGDYRAAWAEVRLCRKYGGTPNPALVKALSEKMPEQ